MLTIHPGSFTNFKNVQISFWFQFGWGILCAVLVLVFFMRRVNDGAVAELTEEIPMGDTKSSA